MSFQCEHIWYSTVLIIILVSKRTPRENSTNTANFVYYARVAA